MELKSEYGGTFNLAFQPSECYSMSRSASNVSKTEPDDGYCNGSFTSVSSPYEALTPESICSTPLTNASPINYDGSFAKLSLDDTSFSGSSFPSSYSPQPEPIIFEMTPPASVTHGNFGCQYETGPAQQLFFDGTYPTPDHLVRPLDPGLVTPVINNAHTALGYTSLGEPPVTPSRSPTHLFSDCSSWPPLSENIWIDFLRADGLPRLDEPAIPTPVSTPTASTVPTFTRHMLPANKIVPLTGTESRPRASRVDSTRRPSRRRTSSSPRRARSTTSSPKRTSRPVRAAGKYAGPPKFKCDVEGCDRKAYQRPEHLQRHQNIDHNPNAQKWECECCPKEFNRVDNLRSHVKSHINPKNPGKVAYHPEAADFLARLESNIKHRTRHPKTSSKKL